MATNRIAKVTTPLSDGQLHLRSLTGAEALGRPFQYQLELLSEDPNLSLGELVGAPVTVELEVPDGPPRHFCGIVTELSLVGAAGRYVAYRAEVRPWLHLLSYWTNSRIFQNLSVPEVVKRIFRERGFSDFKERLSESYRSREYLVQYQETDLAFVSRILEQEGIYYFFQHEGQRHELILADAPAAHEARSGYETVPYFPPTDGSPTPQEHLSDWRVTRRLRSGAATVRDFDYVRPGSDLTSSRRSPHAQQGAEFEVYEYPGAFASTTDGETAAKLLQQRLEQAREVVEAAGDTRGLTPGDRFAVEGCPRSECNKEYVVTAASYAIDVGDLETSGAGANLAFKANFLLLDATEPFRPQRETPKPVVRGPQTALVVGKAGEEIWTDEHGRVKVKFHWDRESSGDERSSCWVRVSQLWAGANFGGIHIPRVGQEVIVDFLEGDPDRPIITGRVYNGHNMPPYALDANKTQSGIKTQSTKEGQVPNYNELRFEDKKGSESIHLQAEKDLSTLVKDAEQRDVGSSRSTRVGLDDSLQTGANHLVQVGQSESVTVVAAQTISVGAVQAITVGASQQLSVGESQLVSVARDQTVTLGGARSESVGASASLRVERQRTSSVGDDDQLVVGKRLVIEAGEEAVIKVGQASLVLKKNGDILLNGKNLQLAGSGKVQVKASSNLTLKGSKISQN